MKLLIISVLLALLPLAAIVYVVMSGGLFTVDGLFMVLILLTIAGVFGLQATLEARDHGLVPFLKPATPLRGAITDALPPGTRIESGLVREMHFFESHVGQQNKTVVEFVPDGSAVSRYISFIGNVKDHLPVGARVRITYRVEPEGAVLLGRDQLFGFRRKSKQNGSTTSHSSPASA